MKRQIVISWRGIMKYFKKYFVLITFILVLGALLSLTASYAGPNEELVNVSTEGNTETVRALLAKGADVNIKTLKGQTALMAASFGGHPDIVELLLAKGAVANATDVLGGTALMD